MLPETNKQYTPEQAVEGGFKIDLFGYPIVNKARDMRDMFLVPPFSILNTVDGAWRKRKKRWDALIGDKGESREGLLMGGGNNREDEIGSKISDFNNNVSILDSCLAEVMCKWFTNDGFDVFDPFAGDSIFGYVASYLGMNFTGIELRKEQADLNNARIAKDGFTQSKYINDTSENMDAHIPDNSQDFIFSCPPYLDLEVYSDDPNDLSTMSHKKFFEMFGKIMTNTFAKLRDNRFACLVISEVRDKKTGFYTGFVRKACDMMEAAGYRYYNEIILVNAVGTLPLRAGKSMSATRKIGRRHQNVLVFFKGDPKQIKKDFPVLAPPNNYYA